MVRKSFFSTLVRTSKQCPAVSNVSCSYFLQIYLNKGTESDYLGYFIFVLDPYSFVMHQLENISAKNWWPMKQYAAGKRLAVLGFDCKNF